MKTVAELMALADDYARAIRVEANALENCGPSEFEDANQTTHQRRAALLTALQESVRSIDTSAERVEKTGEDVQMKPVDELMALADDLAQAHYNLGNGPEHYDSELCDEARAALLTALQEVVQQVSRPSDEALLHQVLAALFYHQQQTRPIESTRIALDALAARLEGGV